MLVVGLTGGIGAGKTTVAALLGERGAVVVDCDALGHRVLEPDGEAYEGVVARFGPQILAPDGRIDRGALGRLAFADPAALGELNRLTHPAIDREIAAAIAAAPLGSVVVLDMAVLVETRLGAGQYQVVVVVEAPLAVRLARLAERGLTEAAARARIAAQATDERRREVADLVVVNDGDLAVLTARVDELWDRLLAWPGPRGQRTWRV